MKLSSFKLSSLNTAGVVLALAVIGASASGCQKDEAPPPLPEAKKVEEPKVEELKIPDAGSEEVEEEKKKATGGARKAGGALSACCAALRQNAANAPEPTKGHMMTAAAACDAANKSGTQAPFLATLAGLLKGAGAPSACR